MGKSADKSGASWGTGSGGSSGNAASGADDWQNTFVRDKACVVGVGMVSLGLMFILTCIFIGVEVGNYLQLVSEEKSREPIPLLEDLLTALQVETEDRIDAISAAFRENAGTLAPRTAAEKAATLAKLQAGRNAVTRAGDALTASLSETAIFSDISRLKNSIVNFHDNDPNVLPGPEEATTSIGTAGSPTTTTGRVYITNLLVVRSAVVAVFHHVQNKLPDAYYKSLQLYALSFQSIYHTCTAADTMVSITPTKLSSSLNMLLELGYAVMESRVMDSFSELPMEEYNIAVSGLAARARDEVAQMGLGIGGRVPVANAGSALIGDYNRGMQELSALIDALRSKGFGVRPRKISTDSTTVLIIAVVYLLVVAVALICVIVHYFRFVRSTHQARRLLAAYGDYNGRTRATIAIYRPVLSQIRTNVTLPHPHTDVFKQYHRAARFILQLRPHAPQALFGALHDTHRRDPDGNWNIESQEARLEMGQGFGICTVLTVAISSPSLKRAAKETVAAVMAEMTIALNVVSSAVNAAGGIVHAICPGGKIICAWNATNLVKDVALVAVTTARVIDAKLGHLGLDRDLNLATGQCITSNCKVGSRKLVLLLGSPFESAERLSLLNEEHVANLVIDADTFKELPREFQRQCKPIALISDAGSNVHTVAMTADASEGLRGDQWKLYNTAFSLYQNNMVVEALVEFTKYLSIYPNDKSAQWLKEHVLVGRAEAARMRNTSSKKHSNNINAAGGGRGGSSAAAPRQGAVEVTSGTATPAHTRAVESLLGSVYPTPMMGNDQIGITVDDASRRFSVQSPEGFFSSFSTGAHTPRSMAAGTTAAPPSERPSSAMGVGLGLGLGSGGGGGSDRE